MARHNYVSVIGFVREEPKFKESLDGTIGKVYVTTIMSPREYEKAKTGYQLNSVIFPVKSNEPDIVETMRTLDIGDIIELTGFIATYDIQKKAKCPFCEAENLRSESCIANGHDKAGGNDIYIYPITLALRDHYDTDEERYAYLRDHQEDVNRVMVLGNLTKPPISGELDNGRRKYTRFQVAINRKYCPKKGGDVQKREDYPWIYSYGDKAIEDYDNLDKGALVFVDGALQARKYKEKYICFQCGKEFEHRDRTLEILSYDTEYLRLPSYENKNIEETGNEE